MRGFIKIRVALGEYVLKKRKKQSLRNRHVYNFDTAKTAGILFDANEPETFKCIKEFSKFLKSKGIKSKLLGYTESREIPGEMLLWDNCIPVSINEIDFLLKPKSENAQEFIRTEFNILFDLSLKQYFTMHYISSLSAANFKVGRYTEDANDSDVMINVSKNPTLEYFTEQIRKYIAILNT
ncbi:MAG: hypothetical protein IH594_13430 [Bacteroidales bacterium]|nr:hypothetical protein [Bacteroidales bacterium]